MKVIDKDLKGRFTIVYYGQERPWHIEWKVMVAFWGQDGFIKGEENETY